ncbi:MAG TPA: hypothetical protein VH041_10290 [Caldimonas sp.]|jgi:hypothetical protein|nr:hypothetical protein [Caldimonas sp.]HEX4234686.1 hypothetical protein [Caldimonas sp.]
MRHLPQLAISAALLSFGLALAAGKPVAYPAKGQSASQQAKDDGECGAFAKQNTGVDPSAPPPAPPPEKQGQRVKGAAAGAAVGAIGGNDVGNAAVKGAVVGGVAKRNQRRGAQQQAAATQEQDLGKYYQAYQACMTGRGYTIN